MAKAHFIFLSNGVA